ncbi:hypothetical protein K493DRAFT_412689 [Basidiobolus meristosporus CBS 931.73]|uniref:GST N-terminal domain-containing protein n=1 Tax=Basidiobolus meristosporus CBS 931.73 TaxID=1314790 RepID=A0A1Y1WDU8_9FUNG|nr:hypothetical protein K493DRAFT_412689 [Basidiobolus meristosporus CBS 931.73]|eukprot:ORX71700.1 hypothetical protein K493DRAFT_412689 [Basidiobolus meristosporus CBS 931.73]
MPDIQDVILHFYPESPFSQKLAWLLNYKRVEYKVVVISHLEPRPLRRPLDGGYRKSPVLQIGNHTYCDTKAAIIALEKSFPEPSFYPKLGNSEESSEGLARAFTMWVDNTLFFNIVSQLHDVALKDDAFMKDRSAFADRKLDPKTISAGKPYMKAALQGEFAIAERALGDKAWVLNTESLSLADVSLAMATFFLLNQVGEDWVKTNLKPEYEHMEKTLGAVNWDRTDSMPKITPEEAIEVLQRYQDKEVGEEFKIHNSVLPISLGQQVSVTPLDTGKVPVTGTLVRSTIEENVIAYKDDTYNTITYIHFPTIGYVVVPAN